MDKNELTRADCLLILMIQRPATQGRKCGKGSSETTRRRRPEATELQATAPQNAVNQPDPEKPR